MYAVISWVNWGIVRVMFANPLGAQGMPGGLTICSLKRKLINRLRNEIIRLPNSTLLSTNGTIKVPTGLKSRLVLMGLVNIKEMERGTRRRSIGKLAGGLTFPVGPKAGFIESASSHEKSNRDRRAS